MLKRKPEGIITEPILTDLNGFTSTGFSDKLYTADDFTQERIITIDQQKLSAAIIQLQELLAVGFLEALEQEGFSVARFTPKVDLEGNMMFRDIPLYNFIALHTSPILDNPEAYEDINFMFSPYAYLPESVHALIQDYPLALQLIGRSDEYGVLGILDATQIDKQEA